MVSPDPPVILTGVRPPPGPAPPNQSVPEQDPVVLYRNQVLVWLARRRNKWRRSAIRELGPAADAASFYAAAYASAFDAVRAGEPERQTLRETDSERIQPAERGSEGDGL